MFIYKSIYAYIYKCLYIYFENPYNLLAETKDIYKNLTSTWAY